SAGSGQKAAVKLASTAQLPIRIIRVEKGNFNLVDDVLALLQMVVVEPLPSKDDKGSQNRTKDGGSRDDFSKEYIERDERRVTEVGLKYAISITKEDATSFSTKNCFIASFSMESNFYFDINLQKLVSRSPSAQNPQKLETASKLK
nr:hypothetical protein [Tanacetum cinerariifolium]